MLHFYQTILFFTFVYLIWNSYNTNRLLLVCEDDQRLNAEKRSKLVYGMTIFSNHSFDNLEQRSKNISVQIVRQVQLGGNQDVAHSVPRRGTLSYCTIDLALALCLNIRAAGCRAHLTSFRSAYVQDILGKADAEEQSRVKQSFWHPRA